MTPACWFFCLCVLSTSFLSSQGAEQDRTQLVEDDEDVEAAAIFAVAPWAILPLSGERGIRQVNTMWTRPGREEEMPESSRSPPFAPRLGRFVVPKPLMGRRRS